VVSTFAAFAPWQALIGLFADFIEWLVQLTIQIGYPSYLLAILIFTIIVKIVMQPLMNKQMRSTRRMQMIQPELQEIKKRYPNNPDMQNRATMDLYKKYQIKPMAGCLPMLIQMPILIALYRAMFHIAEEGPRFPEYFSIPWVNGTELMLSNPDPTWILPIATALATLLQQLLSSSNIKDRTQLMMLLMFPIMFLFMVRQFPSMMAFYWIFYSIIGTIIYLPFKYIWAKQDKKEKAEFEAAMAAEAAAEEERKAKKNAAREAARAKEMARRAKLKKERGEQVTEAPQQQSYFAMLDDADYFDEELDEEELAKEKEFRAWLREQGVTKVKNIKVKDHPWDEEERVVLSCILSKGVDVPLEDMQKRYAEIKSQGDAAALMKNVFGFGKKNK